MFRRLSFVRNALTMKRVGDFETSWGRNKRRRHVFPSALVFHHGKVSHELTDTERKLWTHHPVAGSFCAKWYQPASQYRRLGVIRRKLECTSEQSPTLKDRKREPVKAKGKSVRPPTLTKNQAMKLAVSDALDLGTERSESQLLDDAEQIRCEWAEVAKLGRIRPFFDQDGEIDFGDEAVVSVVDLHDHLSNGVLRDTNPNRVTTLYGGLQTIPIDATTVLSSLLELQRPSEHLWGLPMLVSRCHFDRDTGELLIGVYASRLLFEVMTHKSLQCVMAALDDDGVTMIEPLKYPPACKEPVFASQSQQLVYRRKDDAAEEETDFAVHGSTGPTHDTLYAFSNEGVLKQTESPGNDTSNWPELQSKLGNFKASLMLHQIHGICWMHQMESLPSVNSIFWEKRQFPDGGHYL